jgi:hypothetical protein
MWGFRRVLVALAGLITLALAAPWGAPKAVADGGGDRLGCATYCQNAGGYGAAGGQPPPPPFAMVASGAVRADSDGYVPVTVTCVASTTCQGILMLQINGFSPEPCGGPYHYAGCSDLLVNANSTRTIAVPLTPGALAYVRAHSPVTVGASAGPGSGPPINYGTLQVSALPAPAPRQDPNNTSCTGFSVNC